MGHVSDSRFTHSLILQAIVHDDYDDYDDDDDDDDDDDNGDGSGGGDDEDGQDEKWDGGGFGVPATDLGSKPADPLARIRRTPRRQTTCPHCLDQAYTLLLLSSMQGSCFSEWTVTCDPPGPAPIRVPSRWRIFHVLHGPSLTNPRISHLTIRYEQPLPQL